MNTKTRQIFLPISIFSVCRILFGARLLMRSMHRSTIRSRGAKELRQILAKRENVSADQVICGNGAAELMFLLAQSLLAEACGAGAALLF